MAHTAFNITLCDYEFFVNTTILSQAFEWKIYLCLSVKDFSRKAFKQSGNHFDEQLKRNKCFVLTYCSSGGESLSEISDQRCSVSKTRGGLWQLEVPRAEQMLTKNITQDKEEGTLKAWAALYWFLLPTFAESISLSCHDVAAESSNESLRWLLFPSSDFQLFSLLRKPE